MVDDPYGQMRPDYTHEEPHDAYEDPNKGRRNSNYRNQTHTGDMADWKTAAAQNLDANESRGDSVTLSAELVNSAFKYMGLYYRPTTSSAPAKPASPAQGKADDSPATTH